MDIKLLKQYIANKSPKKLTEATDEYTVVRWGPSVADEYTVVRVETIPHEETHTGIAGRKKTIKNPYGGSTVVLLKFNDGYTTTGVGKNKAEAIKDAIQSKVALFG